MVNTDLSLSRITFFNIALYLPSLLRKKFLRMLNLTKGNFGFVHPLKHNRLPNIVTYFAVPKYNGWQLATTIQRMLPLHYWGNVALAQPRYNEMKISFIRVHTH